MAEENGTPTVLPVAKFDLTNTLAPFMDLHFMFPLIDFLSSNELYEEAQLMAAKLSLLKPTNMADFAVEIYQTLHDTTDVPAEFEDRRGAILDSLSFAKSECGLMLELIEDEEKIMQLQSENLLNASYLEQNEGVRLSLHTTRSLDSRRLTTVLCIHVIYYRSPQRSLTACTSTPSSSTSAATTRTASRT